MVKKYIPDRGDIIWLSLEPQAGREIQKRRPACVISPKVYNKKIGLCLCMPITSQIKQYPFEFMLNSKEVSGVILCDQIRSLDFIARDAKLITALSDKEVAGVIALFKTLI